MFSERNFIRPFYNYSEILSLDFAIFDEKLRRPFSKISPFKIPIRKLNPQSVLIEQESRIKSYFSAILSLMRSPCSLYKYVSYRWKRQLYSAPIEKQLIQFESFTYLKFDTKNIEKSAQQKIWCRRNIIYWSIIIKYLGSCFKATTPTHDDYGKTKDDIEKR